MFCSHCGRTLASTVKFCPGCGQATTGADRARGGEDRDPVSPFTGKRRGFLPKTAIGWMLAILIFLFVVPGLVFGLLGSCR